jgi:hypothetical protein
MSGENFDKKMGDWAERQAGTAPEIRPTAEMYGLVLSQRDKAQPTWIRKRRIAAAGIAFTACAILIIAVLILSDPAAWYIPEAVQQVAFVEQREGPEIPSKPPDKGKGPDDSSFQQLIFQVDHERDGRIESIEMRDFITVPITLTTKDIFRLQLQPFQPRYTYVYVVSPDGYYLSLHPEAEFHPLHPLKTTLLPTPPNWFFISGGSGSYSLYIIVAPQAIPELDEWFSQYLQQFSGSNLKSTRGALSQYLESFPADNIADFEIWGKTLILVE